MSQTTTLSSNKQGHPKGLYLLFFTEMWERFSFYGMRGLLTLYLTKTVVEGGLGFQSGDAAKIYGWYNGLVYLTPIIGGWLADKYLGQRLSILIGGVLMMLGQFSLAMDLGDNTIVTFWTGLGLLIVGNGFFKPNISTLVGRLYADGDPRKDSAFTIFYQGINLGAFLAPLVTGFLAEDLFATRSADGQTILGYGFRYGFIAAGLGMLFGQILFNTLAEKYLGDIGKKPIEQKDEDGKQIEKKPLTKQEKDRISVIFAITILVTFFWAGFEQAGTSLTIYTDKFIDRNIMGWEMPTAWFQSVNPFFIIIMAPVVAGFWEYLGRRGRDLSIPMKMSLGMLLLGVGFFFMLGAIMQRGGDVADTSIKASLFWVIGTYFFHTLGELCISPIGLSMVTKLAPVAYTSLLMGVWFLSPFAAEIIAGYVASYVDQLGAFAIFGSIAGFVIVTSVVLMAISRILVEMMHGKE